MFSKMIAVLALATVAVAAPQHQEAARFPAGVNPAACPSYPNCDNAALHNPQPQHNHAANHWNPNWNAQPAAPQPSWNAAPQPSWNPAPQPSWNQWNAPQPAAPAWNAQPSWNSYPAVTGPAHNHLAAAPATGGDKYPAGVNPQACPNYPFCDNSAPAGAPQVAPLPGYTERQYPAGVSPHSCPNFPYCN